MERLKRRILFLVLIIFLLIICLAASLVLSNYLTANKQTMYIDFANKRLIGEEQEYLVQSAFIDSEIEVGEGAVLEKLELNGKDVTNKAVIKGTKLKIMGIEGDKRFFFGIHNANPGHHVYRSTDGQRWRHGTSSSGEIEFVPSPSTFKDGISQYPGFIPKQYLHVPSGQSFTGTYPTDLRYSYGDDSQDFRPDYNFEGAGVTAAYKAQPPIDFFSDSVENAKNRRGVQISSEDLFPSSIEVISAEPAANISFSSTYYWGSSREPGYGYIKIRRHFNETITESINGYFNTPYAGYGEDRNYYMTVDSIWKGYAYEYVAKVTLTYKGTPDLGIINFPLDRCIPVGSPASIRFSFTNTGSPTDTTFKVTAHMNDRLVQTFTYNGIAAGEAKTETIEYTFNSEAPGTLRITLDSDNSLPEEKNKDNNIGSKTYYPDSDCRDNPVITGDFDIHPTTVKFRDPFTITPKDIQVSGPGCTYMSHRFRVSFNGTYEHFPESFSRTQPTEAKYPYPRNMNVGTNYIQMKIFTTCGESSWIGPKPIELTSDPNNSPPVFNIGWFQQGDYYGWIPTATIVVKDSFVNLRVIQNPTTNPPEPYDPDGDHVDYHFHFTNSSSSWIRGLVDEYNLWHRFAETEFTNFRATEVGIHEIMATATDTQGASSTSKAQILVVEPNPIPVITGPLEVVERRPVEPEFHGRDSKTYVRGRTITQYFWENKRESYPTPGEEIITLEVADNTGLRSLPEDKARHKLIVKEDLPPIPKLAFNTLNVRNTDFPIKNETYSPDGDELVVNDLYIAYDDNNDGVCRESDYRRIGQGNTITNYRADRVGKYCLKVYAEEDWGKHATGYFMLEVVNLAPEVSFTPIGISTEPNPIESVAVPPSQFMNSSWVNTTLDQTNILKSWTATPDGTLATASRIVEKPFGITGEQRRFYYPLPKNPAKISASADLNLPYSYSAESGYIWDTFGPDRYLMRTTMGPGTYKFHLVSATSAARELFDGGGSADFYVREDLDQGMFYYNNQLNLSNGNIQWVKDYRLHRLSDLARGIYTPIQTSRHTTTYYSGNTSYGQSGTRLTFSDGSHPVEVSERIRFNTDIKKIDLTNRRIYSYHYNNMRTPYKTETYNNLPSVPGPLTTTANPDYRPAVLDSQYMYTDFKGNKYSMHTIWNTQRVYTEGFFVKWDANTGKPEVIRNFGEIPYNSEFTVVETATNAQYIGLRVNINTSHSQWYTGNWHYDTVAGTLRNSPSPYYQPNPVSEPRVEFEGMNGVNLLRKPNGSSYTQYDYVLQDARTKRELGLIAPAARANASPRLVEPGKFYYAGKIYTFVTDDPKPNDHNEGKTSGQLINASMAPITNGTLVWSQKVAYQDADDLPTGMSFRIQDHRNMYRVESTKSEIRLVKIMNGSRQVLRSTGHLLADNQWVSYKVEMTGNRIKVTENGVPVIDVTDSTFTRGTFGPYSVPDYAEFKGIATRHTPGGTDGRIGGYAIVETQVTYDKTYADPEGDPRITDRTEWKIEHTNTTMFLNIGDGKSGLSTHHNTVRRTELTVFDKVGQYRISYREQDDPQPQYRYPSNVFSEYRKYSDFHIKNLIVHRRPISHFTASIGGNNLVAWNERSYDPDRCYSFDNCQAAYAGNKGIYQKKYFYITPSGQTVLGKLIRPVEPGVYTLGLAVADEYGAWSDWYEQDIGVTTPVPANRPPSATLTYPTGTKANPTFVTTLKPTITWNQSDPDPGTRFELFDVLIRDEWGRDVIRRTGLIQNTTATSNRWTLDAELEQGMKYQVQVRVTDGQDYSPWTNIGWMQTNRPPTAVMTYPSGTQAVPTMVNALRPTFTWRQTDPDPGTVFQRFQLQVANEMDTVLLDSGQLNQNTASTTGQWPASRDLPAGEKLKVRVRVFDGMVWSEWSAYTWMIINRPPVANFDWEPKPAYEGDHVTLINLSTDPDGDPLTLEWTIQPPGKTAYKSAEESPVMEFVQPDKYTVTLKVTDRWGASNSITKNIEVIPLVIEGYVEHTEEWNANRIRYNRSKTDTDDYPRTYKVPGHLDVFFPGEKFMLRSEVSGRVSQVETEILGTSYRTWLDLQPPYWRGELWDKEMLRWDNREVTFRFTAITPTGYSKYVDVVIVIDDDDYWRQRTSR